MLFDFEKFKRVAASVYPLKAVYSFDEAMGVFQYFFEKYEEMTGEVHPPIRASQIVRICQDMPYIDTNPGDSDGIYEDIAADDYPVLIDKYFSTPFKNCNYRINHFFSGKIRENRFFEELY